MAARLLDGTRLAESIRTELEPEVARFTERAGRPPGLGIILVGDNPASQIYVRNKVRSGGNAGLFVDLVALPAVVALAEVLAAVDRMNHSERHDGILVQSPLPATLGPDAARRVFDAIAPHKDVDGFTAENVGRLVQNRPSLVACTPSGVMVMLERAGIEVARRRAVVIGRSDIVGKPMALLLLHRDATVTLCHSKTPDLARVCAEADILVAALGRPAFVTGAFVKPGATVIDVGITRVTDVDEALRIWGPSARVDQVRSKGSTLVGDVHPDVADVAGWLTPVPGGVGPITIAMLLSNTLRAARLRTGLP